MIVTWNGIVLVGLLALAACSPQAEAPKAKPAVPVVVAVATARDVADEIRLVGRAEAWESVVVRARVDGQVRQVGYREGQHVHAGEVLLQLDAADYLARQRQAEAALARDQALADKARADVERYAALRQQGFVSEEKVNELRAAEAAARASVEADRAALELARLQVGYCTVKAPIAGVLGARLVFPGSAVKTNDTPLAVINRLDRLYVSFAVAEKYLPRLKPLLKNAALKAVVSLPGDAAHSVSGPVRFIDNAVDAATGTILMKAEIENRDEHLTPGQFLDVALTLETLRNAVTVPAEAIQQGPDGSLVFVVGGDDTAQPRKVQLTLVRAGLAVIGQGLKQGERVVTDGHVRLSPGAKVKVKDAAAPKAK